MILNSRVVLVCLLIAIPWANLNAQENRERGFPVITNYEPRDFDAINGQVWCSVQDKRGIMYFGVTGGVQEFDGTSWRLIPVPGGASVTVRSLAIDADGTIFVGAVGDLGFLAPDSLGRLAFRSLLDRVPEDNRDFTDVWQTHVFGEKVVFATSNYLLSWADEQFSVLPAEEAFHISAVVGDQLFVRQWQVGLMRLEGDSLVLVPGGERFGLERIYVLVQYDESRILLVTRTQGLFLFDGETFEPFETEADEYLRTANIYMPGLELQDGTFAFGTVFGGVVQIDRTGRLVQILNQDSGLINEAVYYVSQDTNGDLWLSTDAGISRVEVGSPFTVFDERSGLNSQAYVIQRHQGELYIGYQEGVGRLNPETHRFEKVSGITEQIFDLRPVGDHLLAAGTQRGIFDVDGLSATLAFGSTDASYSAWTVKTASWDESTIIVGLSDGLSILKLESDGSWSGLSRIDLLGNAQTVVQDGHGSIWVGIATRGAYRITFPFENGVLDYTEPDVSYFGADEGLLDTGVFVYMAGGEPRFVVSGGIFQFDSDTGRFVPDSTYSFEDFSGQSQIVETSDGEVWVSLGGKNAVAETSPQGLIEWTRAPFQRLDDARSQWLYPEDNGLAWFATMDGVFVYDQMVQSPEAEPLTVLLRRVGIGERDSLLFGGFSNGVESERVIGYSDNDVRFDYVYPIFADADKIRYRTQLTGFDEEWSDWRSEPSRSYTNLPPGHYEFRVRAKDVGGIESKPASFSFEILPPWYRSWWAYLIYLIVGAGGVMGVVRIRTNQLQLRQRELERTVEERTVEIKQRVEELGVINSVQQGLVAEMDMQGIYDLVGDRIRHLFDAQVVVIRTFDREANEEIFQYAIERDERLDISPRPMDNFARHLSGRKEPLVIDEGFADYLHSYSSDVAAAGDAPKSAVFVPLVVGDNVKGNISLQNVDHENAFSDADVRLLSTLANSMSVALENARLFDETNKLLARADQQATELATVNRISRALVSQLELDALIRLVGNQIQQTFQADIAYLALLDDERKMINFPYGYGDEFDPIAFGAGFTSQIIRTGQPLLVNEDVSKRYGELGLEEIGKRSASYLGVPISVQDEYVGVVSVQSAKEEGRFGDDDLRLLTTIAANVGIAMQNAQAYRELNKTLDNLKSTQEQLITQEKMASLGQLTAGIAHEIKNPLNFVNNFSELNQELASDLFEELRSNRSRTIDEVYDDLFELVASIKANAAQIAKHGKRADSIVRNMMQHASGGTSERFRVEVNAFVDEYVGLAYHGMRAQVPDLEVRIERNYDEKAGNAEMAPQELGRVLLNLLNNALYAVHEKMAESGTDYVPRITTSTRRSNGMLEIRVADNGPGIPDHVKEHIFEPLFTTKPTGSGTGLGLSLAFDIVTQIHGGNILVESEVGTGTTFVVQIPA